MDVVYATTTAVVGLPDGGQRRVSPGSHWPADDPFVRAHPDLFSADPRHGLQFTAHRPEWDDAPVEAATAGPGERRTTRRPTP